MQQTKDYEDFILSSNKFAISCLRKLDFITAKEYLDKCFSILKFKNVSNSASLISITFNNYGCYYKRQGLLGKALKCFYKALKLGKIAGIGLSETYLNISNIFSQQSDHYTALLNGLKALQELKNKNCKTGVLVYQSIGTEYEFLGMKKEAIGMIFNGFIISEKLFGKNYNLTTELEKSLTRLRRSKSSDRLLLPEKLIKTRSDRRRSPNLRIRTPNDLVTDRQITDFISTPVDFEELIKANVNSPFSKIFKEGRSATPRIKTSEHYPTPKIPKIFKLPKTLKTLKNLKKDCKPQSTKKAKISEKLTSRHKTPKRPSQYY
jgi:tetratricopeptide (TPR) repeat protein